MLCKASMGNPKDGLCNLCKLWQVRDTNYVTLVNVMLWGNPEFGSNLVDPASSHMLVSKINPCMCKYSYIPRNCEWLIKSVIIYLMDKGYG